jgi:hypothetical protein
MKSIKLVLTEGANYEHRSLGIFDLDVVPRVGEFIWLEKEDGDGLIPYKVKDVNYFLKPKAPTEIWLVSLED